jgi:hypothetical protein
MKHGEVKMEETIEEIVIKRFELPYKLPAGRGSYYSIPVAKFIIPYWGIKSTMA